MVYQCYRRDETKINSNSYKILNFIKISKAHVDESAPLTNDADDIGNSSKKE